MLHVLLLLSVLSAPNLKEYDAIFKTCYDGDTCTFDIVIDDQTIQAGFATSQRIITTKKNQKIRLCDINAPELKPPNPAAVKARDDLVQAIKAAKKVTIKVPQKKNCNSDACDAFEKYGRLLGYIYADGVNLNEWQLEKGNAVPFIKCN